MSNLISFLTDSNFDALIKLKEINKNNDNLVVHYIISDLENSKELVNIIKATLC